MVIISSQAACFLRFLKAGPTEPNLLTGISPKLVSEMSLSRSADLFDFSGTRANSEVISDNIFNISLCSLFITKPAITFVFRPEKRDLNVSTNALIPPLL